MQSLKKAKCMVGEPSLGRGGGSSGEKGSGKNPESLSRSSLRQSEGEQAQGEHHHNEQAHGNIIIIVNKLKVNLIIKNSYVFYL